MNTLKSGCEQKKPNCFSHKQWRDWTEACVHVYGATGGTKRPKAIDTIREFCRDCTPEYQDACVKAGKCEHPGAVFATVTYTDGTVELQGFRNWESFRACSDRKELIRKPTTE